MCQRRRRLARLEAPPRLRLRLRQVSSRHEQEAADEGQRKQPQIVAVDRRCGAIAAAAWKGCPAPKRRGSKCEVERGGRIEILNVIFTMRLQRRNDGASDPPVPSGTGRRFRC